MRLRVTRRTIYTSFGPWIMPIPIQTGGSLVQDHPTRPVDRVIDRGKGGYKQGILVHSNILRPKRARVAQCGTRWDVFPCSAEFLGKATWIQLTSQRCLPSGEPRSAVW